MELQYKKMLKALVELENDKSIDENIILDALKDGMAKAYKKDSGLDEIEVNAELNEKKKTIDLYQNYTILATDDEIEDDEMQISLAEAKLLDPNAEVGGTVRRLIEVETLSRAAVSIAKNVIRQKIREAQKKAVYNEYVDQKDEMVLGVVESVKDKFALINLGKTVAMMPRSQQIPGERIVEGQQIRVVITEVNEDAKGSQVLVSRSTPTLITRLFEKEVPEIFNGVVEIKAIARDAGERTKMAVLSHDSNIDPIGACIGPRGQRVQEIIDEIHGEKIDIFQYSNDLTELVKNALAPAEVIAVLPSENENKGLLVIVGEDQLSLAIGKKGKNARLAVKLTDHKIDIKTRTSIEEDGLDYDELIAKAEEMRARLIAEQAEAEQAKKLEEAKVTQEMIAEKLAKSSTEAAVAEEDGFIPEEMMETISDNIVTDMSEEPEEKEETVVESAEEAEVETVAETEVEETVEEVEEEVEAEVEEEVEETPVETVKHEPSRKHADLEEMAANNTYVSRFEKLADTSKKQDTKSGKKKYSKKKNDEDNYKLSNKELQKQLNAKLVNQNANKPIYSEEELAEIEMQQELEAEREYDIDYDEYEDYYDEDND